MENTLTGKTIAILIANGFEETHLTEIQRTLMATGAKITTISPENGLANSWHDTGWGHYFAVDQPVSGVLAADFDMLVLPGGTRSVAKLKENPHTARIVSSFMDGARPLAAIGDGTELLATAERAAGLTLAAPAESAETLGQAGAILSEEGMTVDRHVASTDGADLESFIEMMTAFFIETQGKLDSAA